MNQCIFTDNERGRRSPRSPAAPHSHDASKSSRPSRPATQGGLVSPEQVAGILNSGHFTIVNEEAMARFWGPFLDRKGGNGVVSK